MYKIGLILVSCMMMISCATKKEIVYKNVYPNLPQLESPQVLSLNVCKFDIPTNDETFFIGFTKENYKCYLKNQEIQREQRLLYEKFINQINLERQQWTELNKEMK